MNADSIDSFTADYSRYSETELHMLSESSSFDETLIITHSLLIKFNCQGSHNSSDAP